MAGQVRAVELLRLLLAGSVVAPAVLMAVLAVSTWRTTFADAEHELVWTSDVALEHAAKVFDSYRLAADRVNDFLTSTIIDSDGRPAPPSEEAMFRKFNTVIRGLPQIESLIVLDSEAHLVAATGAFPVNRAEDFSDRDYFRALKSGVVDPYISQVQTSRVSGRSFFGWGRSRRRPDGSFDGVIDIALSPGFFMRFYETLISKASTGTEGRVITIIRDDGQILVRYPGFTSVRTIPASNPFFAAVQRSPAGGTYTNTSIVDPDAPKRLYAFRKVPEHPIYIVAGRSTAAIVQEWQRTVLGYLAFGVPAMAALVLVALGALRGARREQQALVLLLDESRRREAAEDQLRQSQRMEAVGQLTSGIAHDFNNLLTGIVGSLDLLQSRLAQGRTDRIEHYARAAMSSAQSAAALTHRLLAFSRRQPLDPKPVEANRLIVGMEDLLRRSIGPSHALEIVTAESLWTTLCDPNQLENAILNLAINARDAMPDGGKLRIETANARLDERSTPEAAPGEYVSIVVSDSGTGMPPDVVARAVEPFFTTKPLGQGTGLGLSMVYGFVKQSEGQLAIMSEVGQGTAIRIYLPHRSGTAEGDEPVRAPEAAPRTDTDHTVLVVEDEPVIREMIAEVLQDLGYRVLEAGDGPAGLALLQSPERIDLLITDVGLPGLNGRQLADQAREGRPDLRVLFITGYAENAMFGDGQAAPGMHLITKPFSIETLSRRIQEMFRS